MKTRFDILLQDEAYTFIQSLDDQIKAKVMSNLDKSRVLNDPKLFKKVNKHIWEFRTQYAKRKIRLLAFWSPLEKALVVCTHGIYKRTQKIPFREINKAQELRAS